LCTSASALLRLRGNATLEMMEQLRRVGASSGYAPDNSHASLSGPESSVQPPSQSTRLMRVRDTGWDIGHQSRRLQRELDRRQMATIKQRVNQPGSAPDVATAPSATKSRFCHGDLIVNCSPDDAAVIVAAFGRCLVFDIHIIC